MTILSRTRSKSSLAALLSFAILVAISSSAQEPGDESTVPTPGINEESAMTQKKMEDIVTKLTGEVDGVPGAIQFVYDDIPMTMVSVSEVNRMRIVAVVIEAEQMSQENLYAMMISNYHLALDARYALGDGMVYSTYIHPLRELTADQIESALRQVANLVKTFGTEYTSGEFSFGRPPADDTDDTDDTGEDI